MTHNHGRQFQQAALFMTVSYSAREHSIPDTSRRKHQHTPFQQHDVGRLQLPTLFLAPVACTSTKLKNFEIKKQYSNFVQPQNAKRKRNHTMQEQHSSATEELERAGTFDCNMCLHQHVPASTTITSAAAYP